MRKDGISVLIWCSGIWDAFIYRYTQIYHVALGYHVTNDMISLVDKYANDIARNHCNFTEALPWLRAGSFVMDTAADAQQFPWVISYILHVTITLKNRTDFRSLFFSLCELVESPKCFELRSIFWGKHVTSSWDAKLFTSPNASTAQAFLAVYVVETILRSVVVWGIFHGIVWHADVLQQCKLWQESKLWNLSISIKATVATVGHKASHTNMCFTYKHVHLVFLH